MTPAELKILSITRVQEEVAKRMGAFIPGDKYLLSTNTRLIRIAGTTQHFEPSDWEHFPPSDRQVIRIPLAIDRENPERGLWGMLNKPLMLQQYTTGTCDCVNPASEASHIAPTPYLALLKALCVQWGITIEREGV